MSSLPLVPTDTGYDLPPSAVPDMSGRLGDVFAENFRATVTGPNGSVPEVHGYVGLLNVVTPLTLTGESEDENILHQINIAADSHLDGGGVSGANTLNIYLTWTDQNNNVTNVLIGTLDGVDPNNQFVSLTIPVFPKIGTDVIVSTSYAGTNVTPTQFTYDISVAKMHLPASTIDPFVVTDTSTVPTPLSYRNLPLVQASQTDLAITAPASLSFILPEDATYQVTLYYQSLGTGTGAQSLSPTISWTDPQGNPQSLAYPYLGPISGDLSNNLQSYSIPFLCKGGTAISVVFTYGGAYTFEYNLSVRIVIMP